jgi:hypothetical protein
LSYYDSAQALIEVLDDEGSYSAAVLGALQQVQDELSGAWVEVRVSGRGDFQAEMRDLVGCLLAAGGYAVDDYSDVVWSLEQIRSDGPGGRTFRA